MTILVAVPVLNRPARVKPLLDSFKNSLGDEEANLIFLCSPGDDQEVETIKRYGGSYTVCPFECASGDYARKINFALTLGDGEWLLTGADDIAFYPGWAEEALRVARRTGKGVIGTQDLGNAFVRRGRHSTHTLVARWYAEWGTVDEPGKIYHEGYSHNWCDVELVETAKHRREWVFASGAVIEHLHPHWRKAQMDGTYERGLADFHADKQLFTRRSRLWRGPARRRRVV